MLTEAIAFSGATGRVATLPYAYFYRAIARCETERGAGIIRNMEAYYDKALPCDANREDEAIHDLSQAISLLEERRRDTTRRDLRDLWYRVGDDIFPYLMDIYWNRADDRAFFALGERWRALALRDDVPASADAAGPLTVEEIAARLEPGVSMIVFTSSRRNALATIIEKDRVQMHRIPMMTGNLYFRAKALRIDIEENRPLEAQPLAEKLYELLIQPLGISPGIKRLVILADNPIHDLPFAALRDPRSGQYLVEQFELVQATSASDISQTTEARHVPLRTAVAVGDPALDRNLYPFLAPLPAARAEAIAVGRQYPQSRTLIGRDATLQKLAPDIQAADVIHIATHTAPGVEEHEVRKLLLAPSSQHAGAWSVQEVAELSLKKGSIVVLPSCQTGPRGEENILRDFAGSFLAAGAHNVVATLWNVDDEGSRTFSLLFHHALRRSGSAVTATREAQLAMLQSTNADVHSPRSWSGFQVYGAGP